jgi:hypothetical protein
MHHPGVIGLYVTFLAEEAVNTGGVVVAGKGEIEDDQASGML